jgi:hypothetical protein
MAHASRYSKVKALRAIEQSNDAPQETEPEQIPISEAPDQPSLSARIDAISEGQVMILNRLDELKALWS